MMESWKHTAFRTAACGECQSSLAKAQHMFKGKSINAIVCSFSVTVVLWYILESLEHNFNFQPFSRQRAPGIQCIQMMLVDLTVAPVRRSISTVLHEATQSDNWVYRFEGVVLLPQKLDMLDVPSAAHP